MFIGLNSIMGFPLTRLQSVHFLISPQYETWEDRCQYDGIIQKQICCRLWWTFEALMMTILSKLVIANPALGNSPSDRIQFQSISQRLFWIIKQTHNLEQVCFLMGENSREHTTIKWWKTVLRHIYDNGKGIVPHQSYFSLFHDICELGLNDPNSAKHIYR